MRKGKVENPRLLLFLQIIGGLIILAVALVIFADLENQRKVAACVENSASDQHVIWQDSQYLQPFLANSLEKAIKRQLDAVDVPLKRACEDERIARKLLFWTPDRKCSYAFRLGEKSGSPGDYVFRLTAHQVYREPSSCPVGLQDFNRAWINPDGMAEE